MHERDAEGRDLATVNGFLDRATGLPIMSAVAESAVPEQRTDLDECIGNRIGRDMRESEDLQPGGIDNPSATGVRGQQVKRGL